ncbi:unnamed protein product (macronuclear) [Paramecium tetraurelia]|uniref:Transmembrane protein n=1 Tax=Paramecium tetraurelia TaxID=5888 RepID=A0BXI7_PARTE|nr:uncharacterized protein GSPATT00033107001 [Paramecium tetraurelia]CAK63254.1 unnamed protein product [Paramecium tetraurelia]|eukprot:XP_001430652.1 hypothetical protein (macronuclear) [Paramecium tetraurelia strain d4-2]
MSLNLQNLYLSYMSKMEMQFHKQITQQSQNQYPYKSNKSVIKKLAKANLSYSSCIWNDYKQTLQAIISFLCLIQHYMYYKGYLLYAESNLDIEIYLILTFVENLIKAIEDFYVNCIMQLNNHNNFIQIYQKIKKKAPATNSKYRLEQIETNVIVYSVFESNKTISNRQNFI